MGAFLVIAVVVWLVIVFVGLIRQSHYKAQNQHDIHRMIKENNSFVVSNKETSTASELEKLSKLHKDGVLSDSEFESAKRKILNQ